VNEKSRYHLYATQKWGRAFSSNGEQRARRFRKKAFLYLYSQLHQEHHIKPRNYHFVATDAKVSFTQSLKRQRNCGLIWELVLPRNGTLVGFLQGLPVCWTLLVVAVGRLVFSSTSEVTYCHHRALTQAKHGNRERLFLNEGRRETPSIMASLLWWEPINACLENDPLHFSANRIQWPAGWEEEQKPVPWFRHLKMAVRNL